MAEETKTNTNTKTESDTPKEPIDDGAADLTTTLILNPTLFAERILGSKAVGGSVTLPIQAHTIEGTHAKTTTIPFYLGKDFSIGNLSNKWGELVNMDFVNNFGEMLNAFSTFNNEAQVALQSENMSSKVWKGSEFGGFNVECLFVATRRTINPLKIIMALAATALPSHIDEGDTTTVGAFVNIRDGLAKGLGSGVRWGGDQLDNFKLFNNQEFKDGVERTATYIEDNIKNVGLIAPLYYGLKMKDGHMVPLERTTLTLQVGDWFKAENLIVQSVGNITFSKEIIAPISDTQDKKKSQTNMYDNRPKGQDYGFPLWGKCSLSLIPYTMMTKEKFQKCFQFKKEGMTGPLDDIYNKLSNVVGGVSKIVDMSQNVFNLPK